MTWSGFLFRKDQSEGWSGNGKVRGCCNSPRGMNSFKSHQEAKSCSGEKCRNTLKFKGKKI